MYLGDNSFQSIVKYSSQILNIECLE